MNISFIDCESYFAKTFSVLEPTSEPCVMNDTRDGKKVLVGTTSCMYDTQEFPIVVSELKDFLDAMKESKTVPDLYMLADDDENGYIVGVKFVELMRFISAMTHSKYDSTDESLRSQSFVQAVELAGMSIDGDVIFVPLSLAKENDLVTFTYLPKKVDKETIKEFVENNIQIRVEEYGNERKDEEKDEPVEQDDFVHLHVHSQYSLLDGVPAPEDIVKKVKENGQPAVALTDHGYMFGLYKFQKACDDMGIKAIHGFEAYFVEDMSSKETRHNYHLILLAMNEVGWKNLIQLNTIAGRDGFYYKPRLDAELLRKHSDGIICLTACYKSPVSFHFSLEGRNPDQARDNLLMLRDMFGDRFYNEIQQTGWDEYDSIVPEIIELAEREGVPTVVTNDSHYAEPNDFEVQKVLTNITTGGGIDFEATGFYLKKREEMIVGPVTPAMADLTVEIANRVDFRLDFSGYLFPEFDITKTDDYKEFVSKRREK